MNSRGRPKKQVVKSEIVHIRLTVAEKEGLVFRAEKLGVTLADMIKNTCLGRDSPKPVFTNVHDKV